MRNALGLLMLALAASPAVLLAQKKDDLLEIERDIANLDERVRTLQKAQDDKMAALQTLVQQALAASSQTTQEMGALQKSLAAAVASALNDQQGKVSQTLGSLTSQMDALTRSMDQLNQTVSQMNGRLDKIDSKLQDITDKVSTINQPPPAPPPTAAAPSPTGADTSTNAVPPGVTRTSLREDAERDYGRSYDDMALKEFADYIKYYPTDEYSPSAGYYIGKIYFRQQDYDDAVQAFQKVIDTWPQNNVAQDALYQKALALEKGGHKSEAIAALKDFINKYPANDYYSAARTELRKLQAAGARRGAAR